MASAYIYERSIAVVARKGNGAMTRDRRIFSTAADFPIYLSRQKKKVSRAPSILFIRIAKHSVYAQNFNINYKYVYTARAFLL